MFAFKQIILPYQPEKIHQFIDKLSLKSIESDMTLLGVTAVEDSLQEDVEKVLFDFQKAGIKTWMLTGDKGVTAIQIAKNCGLLSHGTKLIEINSDSELTKPFGNFSIAIDGQTMSHNMQRAD